MAGLFLFVSGGLVFLFVRAPSHEGAWQAGQERLPEVIWEGLRSHFRGERVLLYPSTLNAEQRQYVLRGILTDAERIWERPEFYNTLLDNCVTSLLRYDPAHRWWQGILDYRLMLPGHADAYAMDQGWIRVAGPLAEQRIEAWVPAVVSPEAANFSPLIRRLAD